MDEWMHIFLKIPITYELMGKKTNVQEGSKKSEMWKKKCKESKIMIKEDQLTKQKKGQEIKVGWFVCGGTTSWAGKE